MKSPTFTSVAVSDEAPVAHHGDRVAQRQDLVEVVADEDHRGAGSSDVAQHPVKGVPLVLGERRTRFVEEDDACRRLDAAHDLEHLLTGHREVARRSVGRDLYVEHAAQLAVPPPHVAGPHHATRRRHLSGEDVLHRAEAGIHGQLLVDRRQAQVPEVTRPAAPEGMAEQLDHPLVGDHATADDAQERRLAGTVLPHDGVDGTGFDGERSTLHCSGATECLGDVDTCQRGGHRFPSQLGSWCALSTPP
jgi:hypothetical protein